MSINYLIPKSSRLIQAQVTAIATFNVPSIGVYNFNSTTNKGLVVSSILPNHLYFLERTNVGGDIAEDIYEDAINLIPLALYRTSVENAVVFPKPLPIVNYVSNQELNTFIWTEKTNDSIVIDMYGILNQTANLVGVSDVKLFMSFNLYDITDTGYIAEFKGAMSNASIGSPVPQVHVKNEFWTRG